MTWASPSILWYRRQRRQSYMNLIYFSKPNGWEPRLWFGDESGKEDGKQNTRFSTCALLCACPKTLERSTIFRIWRRWDMIVMVSNPINLLRAFPRKDCSSTIVVTTLASVYKDNRQQYMWALPVGFLNPWDSWTHELYPLEYLGTHSCHNNSGVSCIASSCLSLMGDKTSKGFNHALYVLRRDRSTVHNTLYDERLLFRVPQYANCFSTAEQQVTSHMSEVCVSVQRNTFEVCYSTTLFPIQRPVQISRLQEM